ncbi:MAG: AAA family ATPase [Bacteroidetes bacterium]|nr:AAA family ATPase [Bacteroidota bacterium]
MKFKKVEIQAFRAYDKVEDSTFDFKRKDNVYADFISIYAPNGFGKTSFYDAVEWGVTKNIHRFVQKKFSSNYAKFEKLENASTKHYVLRNRNSEPSLPSFVRLETTNPKIIGQKLEEPRKNQSDFKFEDIKSNFQEVVLSQEWIDAFLKEVEPQRRYETFIEYFGDKKIDEYYKNVIALFNANEDNINEISEALRGIQLDLAYEGDREILKTTNAVISELNAEGENIKAIDLVFTDPEAITISQLILQRVNELEALIVSAKSQILSVEIAFTGNEMMPSYDAFIKARNDIADLENRISNYKRLLERYKGLDGLRNELATNEKLRSTKNDQLTPLNTVVEQFRLYSPIAEQITKLLNAIETHSGEIKSASNEERDAKNKVNDFRGQRNAENQRIEQLQIRLAALPQLRLDWQKNIGELNDTNTAITNLNKPIEEAQKEVTDLDKEIELLNAHLSNVSRNLDNLNQLAKTKSSELVQKIINGLDRLRQINDGILKTDKDIADHEALNNDIRDLAAKGMEIIRQQNKPTCPLCTTTFDSESDLIDRIVNNKLFPEKLQELLKSKSDLEDNRNLENTSIDKDTEALRASILQEIEALSPRRVSAAERLDDLVKSKEELERKLQSLKREEAILKTNCDFAKIDAEEERVKAEIERLSLVISDINLSIDQFTEKQTLALNTVQNKTETVKKDEDQLKSLQSNSSYQYITNYFAGAFPGQHVEINLVDKQINDINDELQLLNNAKAFIQNSIDNINEELAKEDKAQIESEQEKAINDQNEEKRKVAVYEQNLKTIFNITDADLKGDIYTFLNQLRSNKNAEVENSEKKIERFRLLEKLITNVEPFLKFEKAKGLEKVSKERLQFLRDVVKPALETEKKNVSDHLDRMVNSFFYEDLINDLYCKIDPHPEYKKIKFKCDFNEDKPSLNVFVTEETESEKLIPNLYFSTAQLNILSLSIFLAKALNAKDEDGQPFECIFIDDPIQSMDSINILSTIDLMRSIVVNHKKQIILSTHDDNFFNLLQKKMPADKYNSKFIELETFGKVKADA